MPRTRDVVTGAFSYSGRHISKILLEQGHEVRTLTRRPGNGRVQTFPLDFDHIRGLEGAHTLYNTYWIRFGQREIDFEKAVENTQKLIDAAKQAGVRRIVHISITNPSEDSPLPYFGAKAQVERIIAESGLSYGIVRPTVIFGHGDVFINNIAWLLRNFPFFAIPGDGKYPIQPVFVEDLARICIEAGSTDDNLIVDAAGPETFGFEDFVSLIAKETGMRRPLIHTPPAAALALARIVGFFVRDVVLNPQELAGLMAGLVASNSPPRGTTKFTNWLRSVAPDLGTKYASEIRRNFRRD